MYPLKHKKLTNQPIIGATLLATSVASKASYGQGVSEGGKEQRGINHLTLEQAPLENITLCVPGKSQAGLTGDFRMLPDKVAVVVPPFETNFVKMTFVVSHMTAMEQDRVLLLAYSTNRLPSPPIPTPKSLNKLELDLSDIEVLGTYNVSGFGMEAQPETRIGSGNPAPRVKWEFDINLDTSTIPTMMNSNTDTIYVQAALIDKADLDAGNLDRMILSEVDTIQFIPNECPDIMDGQRVEAWNLDEESVVLPPTNGEVTK